MDDFPLDARDRLPDALRVLVAQFPRETWEGHANFTALTRFWLDRHLMFREVLARLRSGNDAFIDGRREDVAHRRETGRYADTLLNALHEHHHIEDRHYFPQLIGLDRRIGHGFDLLDRDHRALDGHIQLLAASASGLLRGGGADAAGRLRADLARFETFLDRHLVDEEELVVPVILAHAPDVH